MLKLNRLLLSVGNWNQFFAVPKWSHLAASTAHSMLLRDVWVSYIPLTEWFH